MSTLGTEPRDYTYAVFHQPNLKFPQKAARCLGFTRKQIDHGLLVGTIGNTCAGSVLIGFSAVLDVAQPGDRILLASFGPGAGSDAFSFMVTKNVLGRSFLAPTTLDYVFRYKEIDYGTYLRYRNKLRVK
jgi:hydroxymethylglutaryl-CoA synthase